MRNILITFAVALLFTACNGNKDNKETTKDVVGVPDSTLYKSNTLTDTASAVAEPPLVTPPTSTAKTSKPAKVRETPIKKSSTTKPVSSSAPVTESKSPTTSAGNPTDTVANTTTGQPAETKKKGWSSAAKDATIGGVGGAIGGAIISKKKGKGAIIGGVLGAAGGYILGRKKDKKDAAADTIPK